MISLTCPHCQGTCVTEITKDNVIAWGKENGHDFYEIVLQFQLGFAAGELVAKGYSFDEVRRTIETALSTMPTEGVFSGPSKKN